MGKIKDTKLALEQTSRRLAAEEARWRDEADRADNTNKDLKEREDSLYSSNMKLQSAVDRAETAEGIIKNLEIKDGELSKDLEDTRKAVSQLERQKQKYA